MSRQTETAALLRQQREQIDTIDSTIVYLLNQRAKCAQTIGRLKGSETAYCPEREAHVLQQVQKTNQGPLLNAHMVGIFREVMSACLALERALVIAYCGAEGSLSEMAVWRHFGRAVNTRSCPTLEQAVALVDAGKIDYVLVSADQALASLAAQSWEGLRAGRLQICGEVILPAQVATIPGARFWVCGTQRVGVSEHDKTALIVAGQTLPDLSALARHGGQILRCDDLSTGLPMTNYRLLLEIAGHQSQAAVQAVLTELATAQFKVEVLGSYPCAVLPC